MLTDQAMYFQRAFRSRLYYKVVYNVFGASAAVAAFSRAAPVYEYFVAV